MSLLMIIRHAEKPSADGTVCGVSLAGDHDPHDLSVRGWQRAGALASLFSLAGPRAATDRLATPAAIFATAATGTSASLRPQHTVAPLTGLLLQVPFNTAFGEGQEAELAAAIDVAGPVLISWHHEHIVTLVHALTGNGAGCPAGWPDDRFDMVWRLSRDDDNAAWQFDQVPQLLLAGDSATPI